MALAVVGAALAVPSAANAQDYPPPAGTVPAKAVAGEAVPFVGEGFKSNSEVTISVTYSSTNSTASYQAADKGQVVLAGLPAPRAVVNTVTADANGTFRTSVKLTQTGKATLTGAGVDPSGNAHSVTAVVVVVAAAGSGNSSLPVTGQDGQALSKQVALGAGVVLLGAFMIGLTVVWRRRSVNGA
ncbi:hypothetical protein [Planosporangium mesophilum]|uniref:LPXTG cell wall anchor domain-containing protein n=1 Tax=Planosporangium mesophilum TaxID=689768 RepID=A0A8J3WZ38_9ACTN|nr:hypothetical protein [Planosporangium mesophilum]NJC81148.1 hypothetical protein [Planosporangium mesophilum]GII21201.1 hypothetical protein Pme01_07980 [Planosporangium mesophilum]